MSVQRDLFGDPDRSYILVAPRRLVINRRSDIRLAVFQIVAGGATQAGEQLAPFVRLHRIHNEFLGRRRLGFRQTGFLAWLQKVCQRLGGQSGPFHGDFQLETAAGVKNSHGKRRLALGQLKLPRLGRRGMDAVVIHD